MVLTTATPGIVIADDSDDTSLSYQGACYTATTLEVFNGTSHKTHTIGSTVTLPFIGTSVAVYGTISGPPCRSPKSTFSLDDFKPITCSPSTIEAENLHPQLLYQSPLLLDGKHHLVVTHIDNDSSLCLDFFVYLPSPEFPLTLPPPVHPPAASVLAIRDSVPLTPDTAGIVIIDDTDLLSIFYKGGWEPGGYPSVEYNHTTHGATTPGSTATFIFAGTRVAVYGTILDYDHVQNPPVSNYTIDNVLPPATFSVEATNTTLTLQSYYQSPSLTDGQHTLVVNLTNNSSFWLDLFLYMLSPSSSVSPSPGPSQPVHQKINIGAIVGSIMGAAVVVIGIVVFWLVNKKRKQNSASTTGTTGNHSVVHVTDSTMNDAIFDVITTNSS